MPLLLRRSLTILLLALVVYGVCFAFIQHRRTANGPWEVTFSSEGEVALLTVNQPKLGIVDVRLRFPDCPAKVSQPQTRRFAQAQPVPFDLPFGRCVFLDPLFLPGTVALETFGHQIQLMPRTLTIDHVERSWRSGEIINLMAATNTIPKSP
jgi:hypothetical protein